ncbi:MAG: 2Fe-2S iron-sulfur cluster binding domain-containing protein [Pseudomonadales bacterium]|nr:2Fe-2S iron-sulfur cluster binding domain-containing protein [Gammaproteobacteria bacterium]NNL56710.1 2Fe-2S iron-sulfur cluster binding domain-containing protein [Pseudomonadales bacterium]
MTTVTYINADGSEQKVAGEPGITVMQLAVDEGIDGIVAECGGGCACATCHCYVDEGWLDMVGPPNEFEAEMLDGTACERKANSRLSCQITLTEEMDGLIVHLPEEQ